jgi:hypothetical protein
MAHIFISFKDEDASHREGFEGMLRNPNNDFTHVPVSTRSDYRPYGDNAIKRHLKGLIERADLVVCLVGINVHQSLWVDYELSVAKSLGKPIVAVRLPGARPGGPLPGPIRNQRVVPWSDAPAAIERELGQRSRW